MLPKPPKNDSKYFWTAHVARKMRQYRISEGLIRRIIKSPKRMEEGIAPDTVAVMQSAGHKRPYEVWVMYQKKPKTIVISAWRYPGVSPVRASIPIPEDILSELIESGEIQSFSEIT